MQEYKKVINRLFAAIAIIIGLMFASFFVLDSNRRIKKLEQREIYNSTYKPNEDNVVVK